MSSQINTLDHTVMGILLKSDRALSISSVSVLSKLPRFKTRNSLLKLADLGYVARCVDCGAEPLYSAVLDCPYFPPVTSVSGGAFSYDDPELKALIAECDKQNLTH